MSINKGDMMKLVLTDEQRNYCDSAIPMHASNKLREDLSNYGIEYNQFHYVTDVKNNKLINLSELLVTSGKLDEMLYELSELRYLNKQMKKKLNLKNEQELPLDFDD